MVFFVSSKRKSHHCLSKWSSASVQSSNSFVSRAHGPVKSKETWWYHLERVPLLKKGLVKKGATENKCGRESLEDELIHDKIHHMILRDRQMVHDLSNITVTCSCGYRHLTCDQGVSSLSLKTLVKVLGSSFAVCLCCNSKYSYYS